MLQRNLDALTPASRQAFLLRTVEDFSTSTTSRPSSNIGVDEARTACSTRQDARSPNRSRPACLSSRTSRSSRSTSKALVRDLGHEVTGVARTHKEAVAMVRARAPGLVLADIQLADGSSGLDAVNEILKEIDTPVIFITAFPERLLTGEKPEPAFLVTKPFRPETVKATISQALFFDRRAGKKPSD